MPRSFSSICGFRRPVALATELAYGDDAYDERTLRGTTPLARARLTRRRHEPLTRGYSGPHPAGSTEVGRAPVLPAGSPGMAGSKPLRKIVLRGCTAKEQGERPRGAGKRHCPQRRDPYESVEVHLQREKRQQQSVRDEKHAHDPLQPRA